ncbi:MAG: hypothetical protein JNG83_02785 [Opitutaceae bacterium]|nr:hypothetical protein [Opitutaceae bacterium]
MSTPEASTPPPAAATEDRTVAILAYITIIGFIIAIVLHSSKKTQLGAFHLRQVLGLFVTGVAFGLCAIVLAFIPILGWLAIMVGWLGMLAMVIMGLIGAATGSQKPVPVLGEHYQKWFGNAFN